jgi:hypothetical protein
MERLLDRLHNALFPVYSVIISIITSNSSGMIYYLVMDDIFGTLEASNSERGSSMSIDWVTDTGMQVTIKRRKPALTAYQQRALQALQAVGRDQYSRADLQAAGIGFATERALVRKGYLALQAGERGDYFEVLP